MRCCTHILTRSRTLGVGRHGAVKSAVHRLTGIKVRGQPGYAPRSRFFFIIVFCHHLRNKHDLQVALKFMDPAEANPIQNWSETEGGSTLVCWCRFALLVLVLVRVPPLKPAPLGCSALSHPHHPRCPLPPIFFHPALKYVRHPHIVRLYDVVKTKTHEVLVLERCSGQHPVTPPFPCLRRTCPASAGCATKSSPTNVTLEGCY